MTITLYHNPRCSTSRKALALLQAHGIEPVIIDYLKHPPSRAQWQTLIAASDLPAHAFLRPKEALYQELDLGNPARTPDEIMDALAAHPILLNRPVATNGHAVRIGRPPENILDLLA